MSNVRMPIAQTSALLFLFLVSTQIRAETPVGIQWQSEENAIEAWESSAKKRRPILLFVKYEGCIHCKRMAQETFANASIAAEIQSRFVPVMVDGIKYQKWIARFSQIRIYPTTFIISHDNKVIEIIQGYVPADRFRLRLTAAVEKQTIQR